MNLRQAVVRHPATDESASEDRASRSVSEPSELYGSRLGEVCLFIQNHLDEELSLDDLAAKAALSPYHFHRTFGRVVGETVKSYIRRLRLERAAYALKTGRRSVLDLAMEAGYDTHEAFTRAFRRKFGKNPKEYRDALRAQLLLLQSSVDSALDIQVRRLPEQRVVYLRLQGPYEACCEPIAEASPWRRLLAGLAQQGIPEEGLRLLGVCHDDPQITSSELMRFDACVTVPPGVPIREPLRTQRLSGGEMLVATCHTGFNEIGRYYDHLINSWIPRSPWHLRSEPPIEIYERPFDPDPERRAILIYLPVERDV